MPTFSFRASIACASVAIASCAVSAISIDAPGDSSIDMLQPVPDEAPTDAAVSTSRPITSAPHSDSGGGTSQPLADQALSDGGTGTTVEDGGTPTPLDSAGAATPSTRALHGVYHWDAPQGPLNVDAFASWSGQEIEVASAYAPLTNWQDLHNLGWQMPAWSGWVKKRPGRRFVYAVPLVVEQGDTLAACAQGAYDTHFAAIGAQLVDAGLGNAIVRLGWAWDGDWMPWSSRGHEAEYAGCFRSAATAMRTARPQGALQFEWTASDDIFMRTPAQLAAAYPGDAYVDVFGVTAYDASWVANSYPIPANCDDACKAARRLTAWNDLLRGVIFTRDLAAQKGKPMSLPEWGLWARSDNQDGDDNADYVERIHAFVDDPSNHVLYQVYIDVAYADGDHQLSNLENHQTQFPNASAKYQQLFGAD